MFRSYVAWNETSFDAKRWCDLRTVELTRGSERGGAASRFTPRGTSCIFPAAAGAGIVATKLCRQGSARVAAGRLAVEVELRRIGGGTKILPGGRVSPLSACRGRLP